MSEYTPGPWALETDSAGRFVVVNEAAASKFVAKDGAKYIADIRGPGKPWPQDAESTANARLIAAAPELLEACEAAREWLAGWASASPYIETLEAAIKKATNA